MDPKTAPQLDPKLKEIYDRVMGTPTTPTPTAPIPSPTPPVTPVDPSTNPVPPAPTPSAPVITDTPAPSTPSLPQADNPKPEMATVESTAPVKSHAFVAKSNGMKVSPVILAVGAIAFLLIYTVVWIKVFNLSVPFINQ